ncbi:MAG TPA: hypothetical protein PK453_15355 [Leptospiraceae bacterium]|nr:hypothetical protein [Leptospiraceae bacterium]HNF15043.1 hypothetical protein [Leptospiraceae bacterium]HNF25656.1 hypothetical protein [Leptospiraceae bacterium]HNH10036.1 hypothetical protein [Leptospiraceae bacterium]HNI28247.1 hypothetical protein [Leptospiraceae bacterium]
MMQFIAALTVIADILGTEKLKPDRKNDYFRIFFEMVIEALIKGLTWMIPFLLSSHEDKI